MKTSDIHFLIWSFIIGTAIFIGWNYFYIDSWDGNASFDIISGAVVEFFYLTVLLQFFNARSQKAAEEAMMKQLDDIEARMEKLLSRGK